MIDAYDQFISQDIQQERTYEEEIDEWLFGEHYSNCPADFFIEVSTERGVVHTDKCCDKCIQAWGTLAKIEKVLWTHQYSKAA